MKNSRAKRNLRRDLENGRVLRDIKNGTRPRFDKRVMAAYASKPYPRPSQQVLECGCVLGEYRCERRCRYHQAEDDAIYQANERRRLP